LSGTFLILRRIGRDIIINVHRSSCKVPLFLSGFNETGLFSADFRKNTQISNFMKIRPVGAELFQADGQTDRQTDITKLIVAFRILQTHKIEMGIVQPTEGFTSLRSKNIGKI
jgi:hypothetical protein